ncbi:MAG: metalloregulator ArsR/SmtB family transcription factor [Thiotrichales bacterium]|nr:MAG: metalloregulator ArsR/SmtB family transcription factor [Thiotrichales bacterium]
MGCDIYVRVEISPENLFAALSNRTRLRCLMLLMHHDELCVCELTHAVNMAQPHISRHLAQLRDLELVTDRRDGLWIYYKISPSIQSWIKAVLQATAKGIEHQPQFESDLAALAQMPNRPGLQRCAN